MYQNDERFRFPARPGRTANHPGRQPVVIGGQTRQPMYPTQGAYQSNQVYLQPRTYTGLPAQRVPPRRRPGAPWFAWLLVLAALWFLFLVVGKLNGLTLEQAFVQGGVFGLLAFGVLKVLFARLAAGGAR